MIGLEDSEIREYNERKNLVSFTLKMVNDYQIYTTWNMPDITDKASATDYLSNLLVDKDKKTIRRIFALSVSNLPADINRSNYITF